MCPRGRPPHGHTVLTPGRQVRRGHALCLSTCLSAPASKPPHSLFSCGILSGAPLSGTFWGVSDAASFPRYPPEDTSVRSHFGHPPGASYSYTLSCFPTHHLTQSAFKPISSFILQSVHLRHEQTESAKRVCPRVPRPACDQDSEHSQSRKPHPTNHFTGLRFPAIHRRGGAVNIGLWGPTRQCQLLASPPSS